MRRTGPADGHRRGVRQRRGGRRRSGRLERLDRVAGRRLAPEHPALAFHEVRYRVKSWKHLDSCLEDARAALDAVADAAPAARCCWSASRWAGRSRSAVADHPSVSTVVGLAPWIPRATRRRAACAAGAWRSSRARSTDGSRACPCSPSAARAPATSACAPSGVDASYALIRGAVHPIALSGPGDRLIRRRAPARGRASVGERAAPLSGRGALSARARCRSAVGTLTSQARPSLSRPRIVHQLDVDLAAAEAVDRRAGEGVVVVVPALAEGGAARPASCCGSRRVVSKARRPNVWQTELTLQVMWWNRKIRTRPPQTQAGQPAAQRRVDRVADARTGSRAMRPPRRM